MDARQRLLDALAEVDTLHVRLEACETACDNAANGRFSEYTRALSVARNAEDDLGKHLRSLRPTLAALREVVEMHQPIRTQWDAGVRPVTYVEMCRGCRGLPHPCPTIRTLTRQFEEEPKP